MYNDYVHHESNPGAPGAVWTPGAGGLCCHALLFSQDDPDVIYRQDHSGMYRSRDGGERMRSTDGGDSWDSASSGLPAANAFGTVLRGAMAVDDLEPGGVRELTVSEGDAILFMQAVSGG